jgi:hypothetical protein
MPPRRTERPIVPEPRREERESRSRGESVRGRGAARPGGMHERTEEQEATQADDPPQSVY